jgi:hypothetical protein
MGEALPDVAQPAAGQPDRFVPVRKSDIVTALLKDATFAGDAEREKFRQLCEMLASIYHADYFATLQRLRDDYYYFNPEIAPHAAMDRAFIERSYADLLLSLDGVLKDANFAKLAARRDRRRPPPSQGAARRSGHAAHGFPRSAFLPAWTPYRAVRSSRLVRFAHAQG